LKKSILILLLLSLFKPALFSQSQMATLTGVVSDGTTSEPLVGATVILRSDPSIGGLANLDGVYRVQLPEGSHILICRFSGMISDTLHVVVQGGQTYQHNFALFPYAHTTGAVEITVGKFDRPIEEITVSIEVIKPEIIQNKNTRSIETILDQTPGLNILDGEPQIRGGSGFTFGVGSKVAVIVDDMPMLSGDAGRPEWGFIPVENIEQIEVIKGASSVLSGSSALSGAIHIRTAYPKSKPLTKINVYTGGYTFPNAGVDRWSTAYPGIHGLNLLHSRQWKRWDVVVGANVNYDHGYMGPPVKDSVFIYWMDPPQFDTISNFNNAQMASYKARFNFNLRHKSKKINGLSYGVNGNVMLSRGVLAFAWLNDSTGLYRAYPGAAFLQEQFIGYIDPFIQFYQQTGAKHTLRGRILHADNKVSGGQDNRATTSYFDYQFQRSYKFINGFDFIGGVTSHYTDSYAMLYVGSGSPNNSLHNVSGYAQIEKKLYKIINISLGSRLESYQLNNDKAVIQPIHRGGMSIKVFQETYIRASYGQGYRFPTITERFIRTGIGNLGMFPNPELQPEKSNNAEAGIKQGFKFGKFFGYADIAGFMQHYENTIEYLFGIWDFGTNPPAGFKFVNTGRTRVTGLDLSVQGIAKFSEHDAMTFMFGYTYIVPISLEPDYVYATDLFNNQLSYNNTSLNSESGILKYRFLHNLKLDIEYTHKKLAIGVSFKYFSELVNLDRAIEEFENYTISTGTLQPIVYMNYFNNRNGGNPIFDARISYKINESHKIALISANVLNRVYSLRPLRPEPPRTVMLQYSYRLEGKS
jgi:outer membrane receptor protein involved in Fe transport